MIHLHRWELLTVIVLLLWSGFIGLVMAVCLTWGHEGD